MSRLPAYFENGTASSPIARNAGIGQPPRTGITESLAAPGLVPLPPESRTANLMAELDKSLGMAGQFAGNVHAYNEERRRAAEHAANLAEQEQAKAKYLLEGQAHAQLVNDDAVFAADISAGKYDHLLDYADGADLKTKVEGLVATKTDGFTPIAKSYYDERAVPRIMGLIGNRREVVERQVEKDNAVHAASFFSGVQSHDEAFLAYGELRKNFPKMSEDEFKASVLLPAINAAAATGSNGRATVEALIPLLGESFKTERDRAMMHSDAVIQTENKRVWDQSADEISTMLFNRESGDPEVSSAPYPVILDRLDEMMKAGTIDPDRGRVFKHGIETDIRNSYDKLIKDMLKAEEVGWREQVFTNALALSDTPNGMISVPDEVTETFGDKTVTIHKSEIVRRTVKAAMDREKAMAADDANRYVAAGMNPQAAALRAEGEAFSRQRRWLQNNNQNNPEWQTMLSAGVAQMDPITLRESNTLPSNLTNALRLRDHLAVTDPAMLARHADKTTMEAFDLVNFADRLTDGNRHESAILAARAMQSVASGANKRDVTNDEIEKSFAGVFGAGVKNPGRAVDLLGTLARLRVAVGGGRDEALAEASSKIKRDFVNVNGYLLDAAILPESSRAVLPEYVAGKIDAFLAFAKGSKKYKDDYEDATAADFRVDQTEPGLFQIIDLRYNQPVRVANEAETPAEQATASFRAADIDAYLHNKSVFEGKGGVDDATKAAAETVNIWKRRAEKNKPSSDYNPFVRGMPIK